MCSDSDRGGAYALGGSSQAMAGRDMPSVGAEPGEGRLGHALLLQVLDAKVELMVADAGDADVHHVEELDHMLTLGDSAHE